MARRRLCVLAAFSVASVGAATAGAGMTTNPYWHWETVTINPGESYHFHYEDIQIQGQWSSLWLEWQTAGTAHIQLNTTGEFHLNPGDSVHAHVHSTAPFVDWESFTNAGDTEQSMHGGIQIGGQQTQDAWIGPLLPGEMGSVHVEVGEPIPGSNLYELAKWFVNDSSTPQWWEYASTTEAWVEFQEQGTFHLETHVEQLLHFGSWLWINNDGDNPITFVVHFHVPTPGGLALLSVAAPIAMFRRRR